MGTVKYTGPVASFHCPTNAEIRSLKVHFSPKQEGSGDPSPENIRPIVGWDGVEVQQTGKNLITENIQWLPNKWIIDSGKLRGSVYNTFVIPVPKGIIYVHKIDVTLAYGGLIDRLPVTGDPAYNGVTLTSYKNRLIDNSDGHPYLLLCGPTGTITQSPAEYCYEEKIWVDTINPSVFSEPSRGSTTNYEFGVLGKNKFNWDVPVSESSPVSSDAATAREFTLDSYVIGMSVNNYYRQNYANWVLNPSVENGVISFSSGAASGYGIAFPLKLAAGQTYFLSGTSNGVVGATYYNEDGELISYQNGRLNKTITVPDNAATTLIGFYANASNTDFTFSNIQVELGSTATAYEPYNPNKTVYGGWVDLISGEVCEEYILLNKPWSEWGNSTTFEDGTELRYENFGVPVKGNGISNFKISLCNVAKYVYGNNNGKIHYYIVGNSYNCRVYLPIGTNEDTQIQVLGELVTPNTYSLAPTQLQTFLGQNNVWSNADYVEVEYDLHETQTILARKQFIMANQPHIVKPAAAPLQNFVTDVPAPLKECKVHFAPVQNGTGDPSPDNVRAITGWAGLTTYYSGENLYIPNINNKGFINASGAIKDSTTSTYTDLIPVTAGEIYSFKCTTARVNQQSTNRRLHGYDSDGNWIRQIAFKTTDAATVEDVSLVETIPSDISYIRVSFRNQDTNVRVAKENVISVNWSTEAGTIYGGYVDLVTGEVWETWKKVNITQIMSYWNSWGDHLVYNSSIMGGVNKRKVGTTVLCDGLTPIGGTINPQAVTTTDEIRYYGVNANYPQYLFMANPDKLSIAEWRSWLVATYPDVNICYELETPTLITILIPTQLKTLRGTNNIWSTANGNIDLAYWSH